MDNTSTVDQKGLANFLFNTTKELGKANIDSAFTVAKKNAGAAFTSTFTKTMIRFAPAPIARHFERKAIRQLAQFFFAETFAFIVIAGKSKIKPEQHKWAEMAVDAFTLAAAEAGIKTIDIRDIIGQFVGPEFVEAVDAMVATDAQEHAQAA